MQAKAKLSNYRQAPRKVRLIAGLVRGKSVEIALVELNHRAKRAAPVFAKLIQSAVANAKALGMSVEALTVKEVRVDKGVVLKRSRPRAQGRAFPIHKHTSHIQLTLTDEVVDKKKKQVVSKVETDAPADKPAKKVVAKKATAKKAVKK